jgi:hypothetical protein
MTDLGFVLFFKDRISLCSPGWSWIHNHPAFIFQVLGLVGMWHYTWLQILFLIAPTKTSHSGHSIKLPSLMSAIISVLWGLVIIRCRGKWKFGGFCLKARKMSLKIWKYNYKAFSFLPLSFPQLFVVLEVCYLIHIWIMKIKNLNYYHEIYHSLYFQMPVYLIFNF